MKMKRLFRILLVIFSLVVITIGGTSVYMLRYSLRVKTHGHASRWKRMYADYPQLRPWMDSIKSNAALKDTVILLSNGLKSHAFYLRNDSAMGRSAICIHGYKDNALGMLQIAYIYNKVMRMNVLLPDLHAHGTSEGKDVQMGWKDRLDVEEWIPLAEKMFRESGRESKMVIHGISMGAATTMNISGDTTPDYVKCFIEDCGYTSVWDEFSDQLKAQFGLPDFPLMYTSSALCRIKYGWTFGEAAPLGQVAKCHKPMLFIHGDADDFVPSWMVHPLFKAKPQPKELWITKGTKHAESYKDYPEEYIRKVAAFANRYFRK
ncbi:alpha/beta hydrolase [Prevotella brunnea]|uniref:alpha/beta hydrolase n=1 Tax=Prevotella TaxID=838 RepID=UPI0035E3E101